MKHSEAHGTRGPERTDSGLGGNASLELESGGASGRPWRRGGGALDRGGARGAPAQAPRFNARRDFVRAIVIQPAFLAHHADARDQSRRPLTRCPVPKLRPFVRRRPKRGVSRRKLAADRLRGGRSRRTPGNARPELSLLGVQPPMMPMTMARSGRVRGGGRCARCRVPRGGGRSEGRRGGIRGGRLSRAREHERCRGDPGRDERLSLHEDSGSSATGRYRPHLLTLLPRPAAPGSGRQALSKTSCVAPQLTA